MERMDQKTQKGQSLTSVTLKSWSMPALSIALKNIHVKFERNPPAFEKIGAQINSVYLKG